METLTERRNKGEGVSTRFKGFDLGQRQYKSTVFECKACPNLCEVNKVVIKGEPPIFYGARCDRFEEAGRARRHYNGQIPDLFTERNALLLGEYTPPNGRRNGRLRVAIPRALTFYDLFPYWRTFFNVLDIEMILSQATNPKIVNHTRERANVETCFPAKLVYGHVIDLLDQEADFMFLPYVINRENIACGQTENIYCPFIPAMSHLVTAYIDVETHGYHPLKFSLHMLWARAKKKELARLAPQLGLPPRRIARAAAAAETAQQEFYAAVRRRGREILAGLKQDQLAVVIIGRPYNTCDPGTCQDLPFKLRKLGVLPIPMDYLPLETIDVSAHYSNMFWRSGQDILAAATIVRNDPRLHAIYLTNFNCGPDSFILNFFRQIMGNKPFLELEIDDHTADAGVLTRCEAFFESLKMGKGVVS